MRFISNSAKYSTCFQRDVVEHYGTGESRTLKPLWNCQFMPDHWLAHERELAIKTFIQRGLPTELDMVTPIDPTFRFGVFDTDQFARDHASEGFTADDKKRLEDWLLNHSDCGSVFVKAEKPKLAPPWPAYDTVRGVRGLPTAQRIAEKVREDGYDVAAVVAYERENANRVDVLDALEALLAPAVEDEPLIAA